jgi:hypothetical protein
MERGMIERTVEIDGRCFTVWCQTEEQFTERVKLLEEAALQEQDAEPTEDEPVD